MYSNQAKIIDVGLSVIMGIDEARNELCGSLGYLNPEVLNKEEYNHLVDVWSFGVKGYYLFYGKFHYGSKTKYDSINYLISFIVDQPFPHAESGKIKVVTVEEKKLMSFVTKSLEKAPVKGKITTLSRRVYRFIKSDIMVYKYERL